MRVLLDENFPVQLHRRLREVGYESEHIIALGLRGLPDDEIRLRLAAEADLVFLTQDTEFAELPADTAATVLISRVPQALPIAQRVELWLERSTASSSAPLRGGSSRCWRTAESWVGKRGTDEG